MQKDGRFSSVQRTWGKYLTLQDCLDENKEKHENTIFYVTNERNRTEYINMFRGRALTRSLCLLP